jgi:hypothetical protein
MQLYPDPLRDPSDTAWDVLRYRVPPQVLQQGIRANTIVVSPKEDVRIRRMFLELDYPD